MTYLDKLEDYRRLVRELTEMADWRSLPNSGKRGWKDHHLDHIVPIQYGHRHMIPIELIASLENLQFIPYKDNMLKCSSLTKEGIEIVVNWRGQKLIPDVDEVFYKEDQFDFSSTLWMVMRREKISHTQLGILTG